MVKICSRCNEEKETSDFYKKSHFRKYPTSKAGYDSHCKSCVALDRKDFLEKNPKAKEQADRKQHLKRYGLTPETYNDLFLKQLGRCGGCNRHQNEFNRNFAVDHDHMTGEVRGLLCVGCNLILGYAEDDITVLKTLINYLQTHNSLSVDITDAVDNIIHIERKSLA